jgi:phosphatidylserine decarboxylase
MHPSRREPLLPLARGTEKDLFAVGLPLAASLAAAFVWPGSLTIVAAIILLALFVLLLRFFRDPKRVPPTGDRLVVSPADGLVDAVEWVHEPNYLRAEALRISIFMSLQDVHVNRSPADGLVTSVRHVPGRFLQAFRPEAAEVNEHNLIGLDTRFGPVLVKQIAGIMARRVVCYVDAGDEVEAGERIGVVKLGSRVDVFMPKGTETIVRIGDKTKAGVTAIARWQ